jgi:hypothetical protein
MALLYPSQSIGLLADLVGSGGRSKGSKVDVIAATFLHSRRATDRVTG